MIGASHVVAKGFGCPFPKEDGACIDDKGQVLLRIGKLDFKVLGSNLVHDVEAFFRRLAEEGFRIVADRAFDDVFAVSFLRLAGHGFLDLFAEIGIGRDEEDSRAAVVFCLREEVGGNPFRIRAAVSDAADFRGACNHVDADGAKDEALGHSDEGIARACNLEDRFDGLGAVRQHRNALRAADFVDFLHAGNVGSGEDVRIYFAILPGRRRHDDRGAAGHEGGNGIHEDGRRIGRETARHVDADSLNRFVLLA